ncbi:DUF3854 domain-containing protein [Anabaena sp. PCC 7108]|uniref:DUF3854 domain-containing protein n=1 Tax=Anabaena sp. PCC 7108 TaxID=163908 RepID=UPI0004767063|nr:DUF3854 domain-containing protein [Anabaena sp. PCC 7108]
MINDNNQSQTSSTSKISLSSNSQSSTPHHLEQQASRQSSTPHHPEQQASSQPSIHPPNNLTAAEYHELAVNSAIHPELIERNFIHIDGTTVFDYLFISNTLPRLNAGRVTSPFLKLYQYATEGGMWISGLDPLNNWQRMEWGRLKSTNPRIDKNGNLVKYESPPKTPNRVIYFDVPDCLGELVAKRYNIQPYHPPLAPPLEEKLNLPSCVNTSPLCADTFPSCADTPNLRADDLYSCVNTSFLCADTPPSYVDTSYSCVNTSPLCADTSPSFWNTPLLFWAWLLLLLSQHKTDIAKTLLSFGEWVVLLLSKNKQQIDIIETQLSFWAWVVLHPEIPIILCEGEKKAASLLSQGFVAIALPGIWNGRIGKKDFDERLHPDIMPLTQPGRKFIILFDYETKPKTRWSIFQATLRTGKTIEAVGCTCEVALLPGPEKGVDDFIVERSKLIESGQTVKYSQFIEQNQTNTRNQTINQTAPVENNQLINHGQVINCHQVINPITPLQSNDLTNNSQIIECHKTVEPISSVQQLNFKSQVTEYHEVINQVSLLKNNQLIDNGQVVEHHQQLSQNSAWQNNQSTENSQVVEHHQAINQDVPVSINKINALLTTIIDDAISLKQYQRSFHTRHRGLSSKYKPDIRVNVKYLSSAEKLPSSGLVVLSSDMGTNKTGRMAQWREANPDVKFLNTGHRVNLLKNLATRLKTDMYSDLSYAGLAKAQALSITIDSLHKLNTQMLNYGCVFIDEACQYLTHLLHSKTCKEYRAQILEVLEYIVYNAPLVVIADAHMDDITVDFFRAMRPLGEKPFILKNDWRNGDRLIYWYEGKNSSAIVAQISAALMNKQKIMVASDSKRFIKKLEQSLTMKVRVEEAGSREQGAGGLDTSAVVKDGASRTLSPINLTSSETVKDDNSQALSQVNSTSSETVKDGDSQALSQVNSTSSETVKDGDSQTFSQVNPTSSEAINNGNSQISLINSASSEAINNGNSQISPINSTSFETVKDDNSQALSQVNSTSSEAINNGNSQTFSQVNPTSSEAINNGNSQISLINSASFETVKDDNSQALSQVNSTSSETVNNSNSTALSQVNPTSFETANNGNFPDLSQVNSTSSQTFKDDSFQISPLNSTSVESEIVKDESATDKDGNSPASSQVNSTSSATDKNENSPASSQVNSTSSATDKNGNYQISQVNSTSSNHSPTPNTRHHSDCGMNAQSNANAHINTTPKLRLWSIHSDNSGSEENVAFIKDITNAVKDVDALLTSPSLGTGVDINEYH